MATSPDDLQRMLEWAKRNNDQEAIDAVTYEIEKSQRKVEPPEQTGALPSGYKPGQASEQINALSDPMPTQEKAFEGTRDYSTGAPLSPLQRAGIRKPTADQPWTPEEYAAAGALQQERDRELAQIQYDEDQKLARDPANRPSRKEMNEFIRSNTNTRYGASMVNSMGQQMIRDPETGNVRWTAMSPEMMDKLDDEGKTTIGSIGFLAYGLTRGFGAALENKEGGMIARNNFQQFMLTSENGLPHTEQERIIGALKERYGEDHKYVKNPGLAPASEVMELIKQNPDYEKEFARIKGDEWWEQRKEVASRALAKLGSAWSHGVPIAGFGADDPRGALSGRESFQPEVRDPETGEVVVPGIRYDEGEVAPAYPGASEDLRNWRSEAGRSPSLYEHFILPLVGKKTGKTPGELASHGSELIRQHFTTEEQEAERKFPLLNPEKEIEGLHSFLDPEMYQHPESKIQNPESIWFMFLENLPEMVASMLLTRGAGASAARKAAGESYGLKAGAMNKAREEAASRAGMIAGGASEGLLVATHLEKETREIISQIPDEVWAKHPLFQRLTEGGLTDEAAKQIITQDAASRAATVAAVITIITGAPMNRFAAKSAAGRLVQSRPGLRRTAGVVGEPATEAGQEIMELLQTEAAVRPIDPDNAMFKDPNRYWETGLSAAIVTSPMGVYAAYEPSSPQGISKEHVDAARGAVKFKNATNARFAYEAKITDPEHIANTTPIQRLEELSKLESLQRAEAQAVLDAEPAMRAFLEKQGTKTAETELKMLNRLVMRANAMKSDIAVAESRRTTAAELREEEQAILKDRADLQQRVNKSIIKLEDIERLTGSIEAVQNGEAISAEQEQELIKEGYAKRTKQEQRLIILPKGKRATKELNRQARGLRSRLDSGYTGPERRAAAGAVKRELIESGGPEQRERLLYTDPLTDVQNRRAFNERQEHIDVKEGQTQRTIENPMPAVASVDVDSLKWINDNMTHAAGDRVLAAVSDTLSEQAGVEVYRMGGDEFAVTAQSQEQLEKALQAAASRLAETPIIAGNDEVTPTITWGKGENYEQADAEAIDMKRDRIQRGVAADRKGKPATYRVRSQQGLFNVDVDALVDEMIEQDELYKAAQPYTELERWDALNIYNKAIGHTREDYVTGRYADLTEEDLVPKGGTLVKESTSTKAPIGQARREDTVDRARAGDKDAQATLRKFGLGWDGNKPKYRFVSKGEADKVLAEETIAPTRNEGQLIDVTDNPNYAKATDNEYRITFKQSDKFDTDRSGSPLRTKNKEEGEYHLRDSYSLDDIQTIEKRQPDGSYTQIYGGRGRVDRKVDALADWYKENKETIEVGTLTEQVMEVARRDSHNRIDALRFTRAGNVQKARQERMHKIADMRIDGMSLSQMAKELGVTSGTVERDINAARLPNIRKVKADALLAEYASLNNAGYTAKEIRQKLGKSHHMVSGLRKKAKARGMLSEQVRSGSALSPRDVRLKVMSLTKAGRTQREISAETGLARKTIHRIQKANRSGLFAFDAEYDPDNMAGSWDEIRGQVQKGDIVEILTPDGATFGVVRAQTRNRGRPRLYVGVQGKIFKFNPERNWLIVDKFTDPADLAWITGDAEYAQPGRETFPQTLSDVAIGHIGNSQGQWYADLDQDLEYVTPEPWYMQENLNWNPARATMPNLPVIQPASQEDYLRAVSFKEQYENQYPNHPKINIVRDYVQLEKDSPEIVARMKAELGGGSLRGVRGYMDHLDPENGIFVFVQNLSSYNFEQQIVEVMVHEMVGHYGVRGAFGDEAELRQHVSDIVDAFPRLADYYVNILPAPDGVGSLNLKIPEHKQLVGEEMFAYIAGELESGKLVLNKKQKSVWRRFLDYIKQLLTRRGMDRFKPIEKVKEEFWNDSRVQEMLHRSQDFLKSDKDFKWRAMGGSNSHLLMRNANIFSGQIRPLLDKAVRTISGGERRRRAQQLGVPVNEVPTEQPFFPEIGTPGEWTNAFMAAQKPKQEGGYGLSKLEARLNGFTNDADWQFFRDATYRDLEVLHAAHINNGSTDPFWYRGIVPAFVEQELDQIYAAMDRMFAAGPLHEYQDETNRNVINPVSVDLMRVRINDILSQKLHKKTKLPKDLVRAYLNSEQGFDVYVQFYGAEALNITVEAARERLFGDADPALFTEEEREQVRQEMRRTQQFGYDIGYDETTRRWHDYYGGNKSYSEMSPAGTRVDGDFRIVLVKTKGRAGQMTGDHQHFGPNIMHIRTGVAELLDGIDLDGVEWVNPAMEGKLLSLIELQSDHFQHLRSSFTSQEESEQGNKKKNDIRSLLANVSSDFGNTLSRDIDKGIFDLVTPLLNIPDGLEPPGSNETIEQQAQRLLLSGSLAGNVERRSQRRFQKPWSQLDNPQKLTIFIEEKEIQLREVENKITELVNKLEGYKPEYETAQRFSNIIGSLDARTFEALDRHVGKKLIENLIWDLQAHKETIRRLRAAQDRMEFKNVLYRRADEQRSDYVARNFGSSRSNREMNHRLAAAAPILRKPLNDVYQLFTGDTSGVDDLLNKVKRRDSAVIRVPFQPIEDYIAAKLGVANDVNVKDIVSTIFGKSNLTDHGIIETEVSFSFDFANKGNNKFIDVTVLGSKTSINKVKEQISNLVDSFIDKYGQDQRNATLFRRRQELQRNVSSEDSGREEDYDYDYLVNYLNLEEGDTSAEANNLTEQYGVQTFFQFEEEVRDEIESDVLEQAFWDVDWDDVADGEFTEESDEYKSRLQTDEDGNVTDTTDADNWLESSRETYKYEVLQEEIYDDVYVRIAHEWQARGPAAIIVGSLPISWEFSPTPVGDVAVDWEPSEHVEVRIHAAEAGDAYDIYVNDEYETWASTLDGAKDQLAPTISRWLDRHYRAVHDLRQAGGRAPTGVGEVPHGLPFSKPESTVPQTVSDEEAEIERLSATDPAWSIVGSNITESVSMMSGKPVDMQKQFNMLVNLEKKRNVMQPHPLSKDNIWRTIGLRYLISDAVRRGLGGVVWNHGLASASRGGIVYDGNSVADHSEITAVERFVWTKEEVTIRGETQEVFVIRAPELGGNPLFISRDMMIPILGIDAARQINLQDTGKVPVPNLPERQSDDEDIDPDSLYVISTTETGDKVIFRRSDNGFVGFASANDPNAAKELIQADIGQGYVWDFDKQEWTRAGAEQETRGGEPSRNNVVLSQGMVRAEDVGGSLNLIVGRSLPSSYYHTFEVPTLFGARMNYEKMTVSIFNEELKKYGTQISETYISIRDNEKFQAYDKEGQPALVDTSARDRAIEEQHGVIEVQEFTGQHHGWAVVSQKQGPMFGRIYDVKEEAEGALAEFLKQNFPIDKRGAKVFYFPITPQMREKFAGPVGYFSYDPTRDPALRKMAKKVGYNRRPLRERLAEWRAGWLDRQIQGNLDKVYGLRKALIDAEVSLDPYIDARLATSLDSLMKGAIEQGWPVWKEGIVQNEGMSLRDVFAPIMNDPDTWGLFMVGRRAKRLMMEGWDRMLAEQENNPKYKDMVKDIRNLLTFAKGDTEAERVWNLLSRTITEEEVEVDGKKEPTLVVKKNALHEMVGAVTYSSFSDADLEGLSENEKQLLSHYLNKTHWRRKAKTNEKARGKVKVDKEFGSRHILFDWRKANRRQSKKRQETAYEGQRRKAVESKWNYTLEEAAKFGFTNEAEARAVINKLTDLALKKQQEHDKAIAKVQSRLTTVVHKFGLTVKEVGRERAFPPDAIEAAIRLGDNLPYFHTVADDWAAWNKHLIDFAEEMGVVNKETRPLWEHSDYIPFFRIQDDRLNNGPLNNNVGIANQKSPIRRLRGGEEAIGDVLNNIFMQVTKTIDASVKNNAARGAIDALIGTGMVQKVGYDFEANMIPANQLKKTLEEAGISTRGMPPEIFEGVRKMFALKAPKGPGYIQIMRNGKPEFYYTDDSLLYRAMSAINIAPFGNWIKFFTGPKRLFTDWITIDPGFVARNIVRDTGSAFVVSRDWVVPIGSAISGFGEALTNSETMKILTGSGAAFENGYLTQNDPDATKRLLRRVTKNKNIWRSVIDSPYKLYRAWRHITSASENANRVAIYHAARRSGKSLKQAVFEAKDVMDFSMGGDYPHIQFLIQTVPFLNARLQGNYRLAKAARENPASFALRGMMIGLAGWILYMQFRDDERYKELEMWDKHAYHHFWIGADHYRLPKAFEVGAIFNTIPEMFTEQYLEDASDEEKELARGFAHILLQTFAFNPVPQTLMPLVELGFNYDTFRQRPIVSYYEQKRLPPEQFRYTTSPTMRELAKRLPRGMDTIGLGKLRSPMHLQQLWSNYTGTLGRYFLMAADSMVRSQADYPLPPSWETQDYPVLGSFARGANPARRTKYEREVYALLDRVTEIQGSLNLYEKINDVESWRQIRIEDAGYIKIADSLEEAREAIQDINNAIMRIHITDYDPETRKGWKPDEKQKEIDKLEEMRNGIFRKAYELRPGGALNPEGDVGIATEEETESLIDRFGVDDSEAYLMRLREEAPTTAELLQMVNENLSAANLQALARSNEAR